jgi:DnaJ domain
MSDGQWEQFNCYKELEISPAASPQDIRRARNEASSRHHPDHGGSHNAQVRINIAYQVLSNPITRQSHDIYWRIFEPGRFDSTTETNGNTQTKATESGSPARCEPLGGFRRRVYSEVEKQKEKIWRDLKKRAQKNEADFLLKYSNQCRRALLTFIALIAVSVLAFQYSEFWVVASVLACFCLSMLAPIKIENRGFSIIDPSAVYNIQEHAYEIAKQSCVVDMKKVENYISSLAFMSEILFRPSTLDDSEEHVARRLTVSFFLMGYIPVLFDSQHRTLTFSDGGEMIMARFRHRAGRPIHITYVEKLVRLMTEQGISRGFLFCSSGLSVDADNYAREKKVFWRQLESMNEWIDQVLRSGYSGPTGEVLPSIDNLQKFIGRISHEFTAHSRTT